MREPHVILHYLITVMVAVGPVLAFTERDCTDGVCFLTPTSSSSMIKDGKLMYSPWQPELGRGPSDVNESSSTYQYLLSSSSSQSFSILLNSVYVVDAIYLNGMALRFTATVSWRRNIDRFFEQLATVGPLSASGVFELDANVVAAREVKFDLAIQGSVPKGDAFHVHLRGYPGNDFSAGSNVVLAADLAVAEGSILSDRYVLVNLPVYSKVTGVEVLPNRNSLVVAAQFCISYISSKVLKEYRDYPSFTGGATIFQPVQRGPVALIPFRTSILHIKCLDQNAASAETLHITVYGASADQADHAFLADASSFTSVETELEKSIVYPDFENSLIFSGRKAGLSKREEPSDLRFPEAESFSSNYLGADCLTRPSLCDNGLAVSFAWKDDLRVYDYEVEISAKKVVTYNVGGGIEPYHNMLRYGAYLAIRNLHVIFELTVPGDVVFTSVLMDYNILPNSTLSPRTGIQFNVVFSIDDSWYENYKQPIYLKEVLTEHPKIETYTDSMYKGKTTTNLTALFQQSSARKHGITFYVDVIMTAVCCNVTQDPYGIWMDGFVLKVNYHSFVPKSIEHVGSLKTSPTASLQFTLGATVVAQRISPCMPCQPGDVYSRSLVNTTFGRWNDLAPVAEESQFTIRKDLSMVTLVQLENCADSKYFLFPYGLTVTSIAATVIGAPNLCYNISYYGGARTVSNCQETPGNCPNFPNVEEELISKVGVSDVQCLESCRLSPHNLGCEWSPFQCSYLKLSTNYVSSILSAPVASKCWIRYAYCECDKVAPCNCL